MPLSPQSSVGTEIKVERRPNMFPISEPQDLLLSPQQVGRAKRELPEGMSTEV